MARAQTIGRECVERVGFRKGARVVGVITAWAVWLDRHGTAPTQYQLEGDTRRSHASFSRDQAAFREAFPEEESPERIGRLVGAEMTRRRDPKRAALDTQTAAVWSYPFSGLVDS